MNGTPKITVSGPVSRQTSMVRENGSRTNGHLEAESTGHASAAEKKASALSSARVDHYDKFLPTVNGKASVGEETLEDHMVEPATFGSAQNGYAGYSDSDDNGDDDQRNLDDIYNFELSEDQKLAVRELFNLKLDLGFATDEDNRSGLYDLSERVQQLNEELAKEPPLPETVSLEPKVKFKDNVVDFISPTPEPEWDSEEEGLMSENTPQTDTKEQSPNDPSTVTSDSAVPASEAVVQCSSSQSIVAPSEIPSSETETSKAGQISDPVVQQDENSSSGKKFLKPNSQTNSAEPNTESQPADDSSKKPAEGLPDKEGSGSVSAKIVDYRGIPMRPGSASVESEDMALIECSGRYRIMSVTELTALQRRSASNLSPGRSSVSPRPPLMSPVHRSTSLPLTPPRCQSARSQSSDRMATERQALEEERRRRREEAEIGFQTWLAQKKREAAERRRREEEERQKNQPTEEEDPERSRRAFEAWLQQKAKQRREERKLHKSETSTETEEDAEKSRISFQQWLRTKKKQRRSEKRFHKAEQLYLNEGVVVHRPEDCQRAYNRWLRRKDRESLHQQEMERHHVAVSALTARRSRKSLALAHAMTHARALKYTDVNGRRY